MLMKKIITAFALFMPYSLLAQEEKLEVGKHVAGNMDAMSMIISLLMVLAVIVFSAYILKRFQPTLRQSSGLKVISSVHLGPKERVVVVQVGDKQLLLGVTAGQINLLDTLAEPLVSHQTANNDISQSLIALIKGKTANPTTSQSTES